MGNHIPHTPSFRHDGHGRRPQYLRQTHSQAQVSLQSEFEILPEILGQGAFSVVKMCRHKETNQLYAIKIVERQQHNKRLEALLENEVEIWRGCHHPNIVSLQHVFETRQNYLLVMDLVRGGELFDKISSVDHYSEGVAAGILISVLKGVQYLHANLIVHRDIKPENLLLSSPDIDETRVQIADFGVAARLAGPAARLRDVVGTPGYVAPDVLKCRSAATAEGYGVLVDLWSVGVVLYILLSGCPPFADADEEESYRRTLSGRYALPDEDWAAVSDAAKDLLDGLLCLEPDKRLTADQALAHPWLAEPDKRSAVPLVRSLTAIREKKYGESKKSLRAAVCAVMAAQKLSQLTSPSASSSSAPLPDVSAAAQLPASLRDEQTKLRYFHVDAFAQQPLAGNAAVVYPLRRWLPEQTMQRIAAEHRAPVTVFFVEKTGTNTDESDEHRSGTLLSTRWFSPLRELSSCGHGSMAAALVWWQCVAPTRPSSAVELECQSQPEHHISVEQTSVAGRYRLRVASLQSFQLPVSPEKTKFLIEALALPAGGALPEVFVCSSPKLLVVLPDEQQLARMTPNYALIEALPYSAVIVTAPGAGVDFVSRYLCPKNGYAEDVLTVSAQSILAPFWSARLNKHDLTSMQLSPRQRITVDCQALPDQAVVTTEATACLVGRGAIYLPSSMIQ